MIRPKKLLLTTSIALCLLALGATSASAAPPTIVSTGFSEVTTDSATLEAEINPNGKPTLYRFEYGPEDCSLSPCASTPEASIPSGASPVLVSAGIEGLAPGTKYHFRAVAKNSEAIGGVNGPVRTFKTFGLPSPFPPCPNDSLRTEENPMSPFIEYLGQNLPDCRAYEQASPVDKNGLDVKGLPVWVKASSEGDAVTFMPTAGIPGGEGAQAELPPMLARRGADDWSTEGMLPPASTGQEALVMGWAPDFSHVFTTAVQLTPARATAILSRSAEGEITEVLPHTTQMKLPPFMAGSDLDGSVMAFESSAELQEEAIEGASNVYAWERSSGELRLASILNDETSPPQGAFAGSYDWGEGTTIAATDEGGSARDYYTQDQHAISEDGAAIYFTAAGTGRLYLRVNPTEAQSPLDLQGKCTNPGLACTIEVSASKKTNGGGPNGTDAAGHRPAAFMGASADGSVAYFTSPEKLTNDAYTGPEPLAPAIAQAPKDDGDPKDIDFQPAKAAGIALSATHFYWANPEAGTIERAPLGGGAETEVFVSGLENPQYVALDATHVYWSATGPLLEGKPQDGLGTIGRAEIGATEGEEVEEDFITGASNPQGVAVNAEHIYWANGGRLSPDNSPGAVATRTIGRAKLGPTGAEEVEQDCLQVDQGGQEEKPQGIAINATHIYAATNGTQSQSYLLRYDLGCGEVSPEFVFDSQHIGQEGLRGVAIDAEFLYWARRGQNTIGRIPLGDFDLEPAARTPQREWIQEPGFPTGVALAGSEIFWAANQGTPVNAGNDLYRYEVASGELSDLSVDTSEPVKGADVQGILGASEDGASVYFAANGVLAAGATPGSCDGGFTDDFVNYSGECNLYLAREGEATQFVARLDAGGASLTSDAANWAPHGGAAEAAATMARTARVSADGDTVLFRSQRQLTDYENKGTPMFYRLEADDAAPSCVSCNPTGAPPVGRPSFGRIGLAFLSPANPAMVLSRNLSVDGNRVFFETINPLVGADTNGEEECPLVGPGNYSFPNCLDVYEWEAQGTGSCEEDVQGGGCLYLLSDGAHDEASFFGDASASGESAFLITSSRLVGQDQDQLYDLYGARVEGGLLSQNKLPPPDCESSETCPDPPPPPPVFPSPATPEFEGPGNPKAKAGCPKGKRKARVKGKARCVAKRKRAKRGGKGKSGARASISSERVSR